MKKFANVDDINEFVFAVQNWLEVRPSDTMDFIRWDVETEEDLKAFIRDRFVGFWGVDGVVIVEAKFPNGCIDFHVRQGYGVICENEKIETFKIVNMKSFRQALIYIKNVISYALYDVFQDYYQRRLKERGEL